MKRGPIARTILVIFFVGLIAVPVIITHVSAKKQADAGKMSEKEALARYGFYFTEVSKQAGVHFIHQAPQLDPKLSAIMP